MKFKTKNFEPKQNKIDLFLYGTRREEITENWFRIFTNVIVWMVATYSKIQFFQMVPRLFETIPIGTLTARTAASSMFYNDCF